MTLALIGINHKTAPIELRERIAISRDELPETTRALAAVAGVSECMIVSTCNRVELIASLESADTDLASFLHRQFGLDPALLAPHIYRHYDQNAVRHLFRVAASLDSMVVGEPQILGQVKEAFAYYDKLIYPGQKVLGAVDPERMTKLQDFYLAKGIIQKKSPVEDLFTNQFVT